MFKNWFAEFTYTIYVGTVITALTVDHWYVAGAISGILSTLAAMACNFYFSRKADQQAEEQLKQIMSGQ